MQEGEQLPVVLWRRYIALTILPFVVSIELIPNCLICSSYQCALPFRHARWRACARTCDRRPTFKKACCPGLLCRRRTHGAGARTSRVISGRDVLLVLVHRSSPTPSPRIHTATDFSFDRGRRVFPRFSNSGIDTPYRHPFGLHQTFDCRTSP